MLKDDDATADDVNAAFEALELARAGLVERKEEPVQSSRPNQQQNTAEDADELTDTGSSIVPVLMIALVAASAGAMLTIASAKRRVKRH